MRNKTIEDIKYLLDEYGLESIKDNLLVLHYDKNELKEYLSTFPDVIVVIKVYSNYDCTNSFDDPKDRSGETYCSSVFSRVKAGVKLDDFAYEHYGAFGGALFCYVFKTSFRNAVELAEAYKIPTNKYLFIPKGIQFGFYSSFQGSASMFDKETYRNSYLELNGETKYDSFEISLACHSDGYSLNSIFGSFICDENNNVKITKEK